MALSQCKTYVNTDSQETALTEVRKIYKKAWLIVPYSISRTYQVQTFVYLGMAFHTHKITELIYLPLKKKKKIIAIILDFC